MNENNDHYVNLILQTLSSPEGTGVTIQAHR